MRVSVIGDIERHRDEIMAAARMLHARGCTVISPVDEASGMPRHHALTFGASELLWLVAPDGEIRSATSLKIGMALGLGIPTCAAYCPDMRWASDHTLRMYVYCVADVEDARGQLPAMLHDLRGRQQWAARRLQREFPELRRAG